MGDAVTLEIDRGLATIRMSREHGNAINGELVEGLTAASAAVARASEVRGVMFAAGGRLFCPGFDLQELIELSRPEMEAFVRGFADCLLALYTLYKPVVAAIHGHAVAGGFVLSLTADWRVLREDALVGLNEVRVGVPLPFGVAMILRDSVPAARLEEVALFGRNYTNQDALNAGLVHEVHPEESFEERCQERLEELTSKDARAFAVTKRYLRSATVERIHVFEGQLAHEFLDCWFSAGTQQRLRRVVRDLRGG
jgi:enoyl-CoA hydratase